MKRYSLLVSAFIAAPLLVAAWWSRSQYAVDYYAMQEAQRQCEVNGLKCGQEVVRRPKKRKDECGFVAALSPQASVLP